MRGMFINGKIIGIIIGLLFLGPLGAVIGFILGAMYDSGVFDPLVQKLGFRRGSYTGAANVQKIFYNSAFRCMGYIAKADGRVSESEIAAAQAVMRNLGLSNAMQREAIELFNQGKQPGFDIKEQISKLRSACWRHPNLLRMFLEIQIQMANAGTMTPGKKAALQSIFNQLGLAGFNFSQFEQRYRAGQNYQRYRQQPRQDPRAHLKDAYQILDVTPQTSDADVKKAYRRMMSKHHPDKLIADGMPPEMIKMATQKTQQIKSAYETIKEARGI